MNILKLRSTMKCVFNVHRQKFDVQLIDINPDSNVTVGRHRLPVVAHHTDVQLILGGPLAT